MNLAKNISKVTNHRVSRINPCLNGIYFSIFLRHASMLQKSIRGHTEHVFRTKSRLNKISTFLSKKQWAKWK